MKPNLPPCNNSFYGNKQSLFRPWRVSSLSVLVFLYQALDFRILFKKKKQQKLKTSTKALSLQGRGKNLFCHVQNGGPTLELLMGAGAARLCLFLTGGVGGALTSTLNLRPGQLGALVLSQPLVWNDLVLVTSFSGSLSSAVRKGCSGTRISALVAQWNESSKGI